MANLNSLLDLIAEQHEQIVQLRQQVQALLKAQKERKDAIEEEQK